MAKTAKEKFLEPFSDGTPYVEVTPDVEEILMEIARSRNTVHKGRKPSTHPGLLDTTDVHYTGMCGEWAFSDYYGLQLNTRSDMENGDFGYDFVVRHTAQDEVGTVDVKTIRFFGGDLLVPHNRVDADCYVLCEIRQNYVGLVGAANSEMVKQSPVEREKFPEQSHQVPREELLDLPEPDGFEPAIHEFWLP